MKEYICAFISTLVTVFVYMTGGIDVALQCLLIAIVLDYISGLIKAFTTKTLSSRIGLRGLIKKIGVLVLVMLAVLVDRVTGESGAIRTVVIYYFVANEGLSIIENLAQAGLPIPKVIKNALKVLKNQTEVKNK